MVERPSSLVWPVSVIRNRLASAGLQARASGRCRAYGEHWRENLDNASFGRSIVLKLEVGERG
jgi:hypothetical protein